MAERLALARMRVTNINDLLWKRMLVFFITLGVAWCSAIPHRGLVGIYRLTKRSPLEMGSSFIGNVPLFPIRSHIHLSPIVLSHIPIIQRENIISRRNFNVNGYNNLEKQGKNTKGPIQYALNVITGSETNHFLPPTKLHVVSLPHAVSNVMKTSIHTQLEHIVTDGNEQIPVLTHTISHSSANITHALHDNLLPVILSNELIHPLLLPTTHQHLQPLIATQVIHPVHPLHIVEHVQQQPVFPATAVSHQNQMLGNLVASNHKNPHSEPITSLQEEETESEDFRKTVGGYGVGLRFGGQGAGHGYYAFGR